MKENVFRAFGLALVIVAFGGCASTPSGSSGPQPWDVSSLEPGKVTILPDGSRWLLVGRNVRVVTATFPFFIPKNEDPSYGVLENLDRVARLDILIFWTPPGGTRCAYLAVAMEPGIIVKTNIFAQGNYDLVIFPWRHRFDGWHTLGRHFASFTVADDPHRFTWPPGQREALEFVGWISRLGPYADTDLNAPTGGRGPTLVLNFDFTGGDAIARAFTNWVYGRKVITVYPPYYPQPQLNWCRTSPEGG